MDDERFCTRCGENVANIPPEGGPQYVNGNPQQTAYAAPQQNVVYAQPVQPIKVQEEMSLGKWVGTIIVTSFFGIISLIFLFVWGFGDGPESRKNYCKAMLIVEAISIVLGILMMIIFGGIFSVIGASLADYIERSQRYQYGAAAAIMQIIGM